MEHPVSPATPPSLDRHSEALSERMRNDVCFACKKQGHWMKDCPGKSPARSQPSSAAAAAAPPSLDRHGEAPSQETRSDACFACKKQGHWMKDCPDKSPAKPRPSAADVPVLQCRCGAGACAVRTSHSLQNPDRKYYVCPDRARNGVDGCDFFAWCDKYSAPMCPCGAGRCRINFFEHHPHKGRIYFSCRIIKGHGACKFFQWADSPTENVTSRDVATSVIAPPEVVEIESAMADAGEDYKVDPLLMMDSSEIQEVICRFSAPERHVRVLESESLIPEADLDTQELAMEDVDLEVVEIESAMADAGEDYKVDPLLMMDSSEIQEEICRFSAPERHVRVLESESLIPEADLDTQELAMEDMDLGESTTEQMQFVSHLTSPSPVRLRQQECLRQISAAGDMLAGSRDTVDMLLGCLAIRWCGRLAFPPSPSLADPSPTPSFCGIFPSLAVDHMDISSAGQSHLESGMDYQSLQFSAGNSLLAEHVSETRSEVSRCQSHPELASNHWSRGKALVLNRMAKLFQKDIIDLLEKNSLDHAHLEQEARDRLDCLDFLPVDSSQFKEQVEEFLLCASQLAEAERPVNETAMPNVLEHCRRAKKRFHDISEKHSVTSDAYAACDGRIKHLQEDYHRAKETLLRIEAELHGCKMEHAELQGRLAEITREMEEAKSSMEEASREASLAVQRREIERCTARAALEKARLQLRSNLRKRACVVINQP